MCRRAGCLWRLACCLPMCRRNRCRWLSTLGRQYEHRAAARPVQYCQQSLREIFGALVLRHPLIDQPSNERGFAPRRQRAEEFNDPGRMQVGQFQSDLDLEPLGFSIARDGRLVLAHWVPISRGRVGRTVRRARLRSRQWPAGRPRRHRTCSSHLQPPFWGRLPAECWATSFSLLQG